MLLFFRQLSPSVRTLSRRSVGVRHASTLEPIQQSVPYGLYQDMIRSKDEMIRSKDEMMERMIQSKDETIQKMDVTIQSKDETIQSNVKTIQWVENAIQWKTTSHAKEVAQLNYQIDVAKGRYNARALLETVIDVLWQKCDVKSGENTMSGRLTRLLDGKACPGLVEYIKLAASENGVRVDQVLKEAVALYSELSRGFTPKTLWLMTASQPTFSKMLERPRWSLLPRLHVSRAATSPTIKAIAPTLCT